MLTLKRAALLFVLLAVLVGCGGKGTGAATKSAVAPATSSGNAATAGDSSSTQGSQVESFACASRLSGGTASAHGQLTDVRAGRHEGFDRITFQFESSSGVPQYRLLPQSSAGFKQDPSGRALNLEGMTGLGIVFPGSSGVDLGVTPFRQTYTGSQDIKPGLLLVRELAQVGDFERVLSWGVGLSSPPCLRLIELSNPVRLVVDVRSASTGPSAAEIKAVAQQVFAGEYPMGCSPKNRSTCPMTDRLANRFAELSQPIPGRPGPPNLWCGCQNPASQAINIDAEATANGGIAHVTLYPDVNPIKLDLIVVRQAGTLLVDDVQYAGRGTSTSIYAPQMAASGS